MDHSYMWRLDNYWRIEEKTGGVYLQIEVVALSRKFPLILGWLINPLIENIPRSTISGFLNNSRRAITERNATTVDPVASSPPLGSHP